jgi:predicted metalloprotease
MRWRSGRESDNVEDRRDGGGGGNGGGGFHIGVLGTAAIVVVGWFMGINPIQMLGIVGGANAIFGGSSHNSTNTSAPVHDTNSEFASKILAQTEDIWNPIFRQLGGHYTEPKLVLFSDSINSACGSASANAGPFYCPGDQKVYLDLNFFKELDNLGAPGEFARAYVIGHEIGHHVQNLLGTSDKVSQMQARMSQRDGNLLSVALELQADCYAGVWANHANAKMHVLESGDIESAVNAAASIGDDRLQKMSGRHVNPDAFTHGSSRQRMEWLQRGLQSGDIRQCDTFSQLH